MFQPYPGGITLWQDNHDIACKVESEQANNFPSGRHNRFTFTLTSAGGFKVEIYKVTGTGAGSRLWQSTSVSTIEVIASQESGGGDHGTTQNPPQRP